MFQKDASCRLGRRFHGLGGLKVRRLLLFLFSFPPSELENLHLLPLLDTKLLHVGDEKLMQSVSSLQNERHQRSNREENS